jgi:hypothetical protein
VLGAVETHTMHIPTVLIGVAAFLYGIYTAWARVAKPGQFGKLEAMKKALGPTTGNIVHLIAYTLVPIGVGVVFLLAGLQGRSIF